MLKAITKIAEKTSILKEAILHEYYPDLSAVVYDRRIVVFHEAEKTPTGSIDISQMCSHLKKKLLEENEIAKSTQ